MTRDETAPSAPLRGSDRSDEPTDGTEPDPESGIELPLSTDGGIDGDGDPTEGDSGATAPAGIDPDDDARRKAPVVVEVDSRPRVWATGWYRVRPRTFHHHELFFDPDRVYCVYVEESFKSYLLRRSGREREAAKVGREYLTRPLDDLLDHSRSFAIDIVNVDEIRLRSGSLLFKPKLAVETSGQTSEFYHWRRGQDVRTLATTLRDMYDIDVTEK
ncbi:hypothetical protein [Halobaculum sp. EA56]|uniref:hypothetical protein n=1 Tax=Halobaculum sp. EA56 TaxID=3421648 RepID=UPI003EB6F551